METFDTEINTDYHLAKFDTQSSLVNDVVGGIGATIVDAGASLWNSLPFTEEVSTADLLSRVSDNALRVYEENPETIHLASFIGGSLIPGGLAIKGMNAMRNGSKAVNWFTKAGKQADMDLVTNLMKTSGPDTKQFRNAVRGMYAKTAVNQAIDAAAFEVAALGAMNASPFVEDYMKDPVTNFGISVALGGVLGGAMGAIADSSAVKNVTGGIFEDALRTVMGKALPINPTAPHAANLMASNMNISSYDAIIEGRKALGFTEESDLLANVATRMKAQAITETNDIFDNMLASELGHLPVGTRDTIKERMAKDFGLIGVEHVRPVKDSDFGLINITNLSKAGVVTPNPILQKVSSKAGPTQPVAQEAVWFPGLGHGTKNDIDTLAGANALNGTPESWAKELPFGYGKTPSLDAAIELMGSNAASIQKQYVAAMEKVDKMSLKQIKALSVGISDGPLITALLARAAKDEEVAKIAVKVFDKTPVYKTVMEQKTEQLIASGVISRTGPNPTYQKSVDAFAGHGQLDNFRPRGGKVTVSDGLAIEKWINGGLLPFREAYTYYQAFKFANGGGSSTKWGTQGLSPKEKLVAQEKADMMGRLIESPQSEALRNKFRTYAEKGADGKDYVYLYRGQHGHNSGHSALASYTTSPTKGGEFGSVRLYKVSVDDILMGFEDSGIKASNAEILVRAASHIEEATVDKVSGSLVPSPRVDIPAGTPAAGGTVTNVTTTTSTVTEGLAEKNIAELKDLLIAQKQEAIDTLLANGVPIDSIAIKTNTDKSLILAYAGTADKTAEGFADLYKSTGNASIVSSTDSFAKVLDKANAPLILKGNMKKNAYTAAFSALDQRSLQNINSEIIAASLASSTNKHVNALGDLIMGEGKEAGSVRYYLDILRSEIFKGNNAFAGKAFINSFDFFARNMGHLGPMISRIGREVEKIRNNFISEINDPLAAHMTKIGKSQAEVIEFNTFREVNAGLKDWRGFRQSEETGEWNIVQKVAKKDADGKSVTVLEPVMYQGAPYKVVSPSVIDTINYIQEISPKLLSLANASKRIKGMNNVNDIGLWIPSFNPVNKFIAYVRGTDDSTKILWANTADEHETLIKAYQAEINKTGSGERIIRKGDDQAEWSRANGRLDTIHMEVADISKLKGGSSASVNIRTDNQVFGEIAAGYEHYINAEMRQLTDLSMSDITDTLGKMSKMNRGSFDSQPLSLVKKITEAPKDAATTLRNTLLGNPNLGEYEGWKSINQSFEGILSYSVGAVNSIWKATVSPITKGLLGRTKELTPEAMARVDYEKVMKEMNDKGIVIWKGFDDEVAKARGFAKLEDSPDISKRLVYASNALAATLMLRVGELAQPLVNMMSLPILTALAAGSKMPDSFMGVAKGTANVNVTQIIIEGARAVHSPQFAALEAKWIKAGYFDSVVSEANKSLRAARSMDRGAIAATEKFVDSNIVKMLSWGADKSEMLVRRQTMFTGAVLAKRLYPELDDVGVTIFARDFMDKAVGNFEASQRPVFFQGTLGVALGLFQTYSVTLAQSIYRQLELKNYKTLAKAMLAQSTIFGTSSMPGFNPVSQLIGEHFSDDHYDLHTGAYRALPDKVAQTMLYGLPSLAGVGIYTRGDSNFRAPGADGIVAVNAAQQITQAVQGVAKSMGEGSNAGHAMMQALSLQNVSRPLARTMEIATGYSVTRQGNTVQTPEEVWTATGIMSRILGARPVEETKLREMMHLNTYYGSIDRDNRQSLMIKLKNDIRAGTLTDEGIAEYGEAYMRNGGSPAGWRSAVATAIGRTQTSGKETLVEKLKPTSPFMHMMDGLDGS